MSKILVTIAKMIARLLPPRVVYFALIRAWAYATSANWSDEDVATISMDKTVRRWGWYVDQLDGRTKVEHHG